MELEVQHLDHAYPVTSASSGEVVALAFIWVRGLPGSLLRCCEQSIEVIDHILQLAWQLLAFDLDVRDLGTEWAGLQ